MFDYAIIVVLLIIVAVYVLYPVYFEMYVLMKVPEYRALKEKLVSSESILASTVLALTKSGTDAAKATEVASIANNAAREILVALHKEDLLKASSLAASVAEKLVDKNKAALNSLVELHQAELLNASKAAATAAEKVIIENKNARRFLMDFHQVELLNASKAAAIAADKVANDNRNAHDILVALHTQQLLKCSMEIAKLKEDLAAALGKNDKLAPIQTSATNRMKELNDTVIVLAPLGDVELAKRIRKIRELLMAVPNGMRVVMCSKDNKMRLIDQVRQLANNMRKPPFDRLDTGLCNYKDGVPHGAKSNWSWIKKSVMFQDIKLDDKTGLYVGSNPRFVGDADKFAYAIDNLLEEVETVISYIMKNKFCNKDLQFQTDEFEKYALVLLNTFCEGDLGSTSWISDYNIPLENTMRKLAEFLPVGVR